MKNEIIVLVGPSACGKDTIARVLEKKFGYNFIVSTTTRPIRPGESESNPYHFVDNDYFNKLIDEDKLIEYRSYSTLVNNSPDIWYYGVEETEVKENCKYIVVLDITGLKEFKKFFKKRVVAFFLKVDDETRKTRCMSRGDFNESEWNRRLSDDKKVFNEDDIEKYIDFIIENPDGDDGSKVAAKIKRKSMVFLWITNIKSALTSMLH